MVFLIFKREEGRYRSRKREIEGMGKVKTMGNQSVTTNQK